MKTIVVLGAKPGAQLPRFDLVYAANAAASYHDELEDRQEDVITVASEAVISKCFYPPPDANSNMYEKKGERLLRAPSGSMRLCLSTKYQGMVETLRKKNYSVPIEVVSPNERIADIRNVSGACEPFYKNLLRAAPRRGSLLLIRSLIKVCRARVVGREGGHTSFFRPSTGVYALCRAIVENGRDARYVVSGIGLEARGVYSDGRKQFGPLSLPPHVYPDIEVLDRLTDRYPIFTTEDSLLSHLPAIRKMEL